MKTRYNILVLASVSAFAFSAPAYAQDATGDDVVTEQPAATSGSVGDAIVVTARRRAESVQDVPAVVDTVSAEEFAKLNLRDFSEVQRLVPGLSLTSEANGTGGNAQLRGVNFNVNASGNNPTVEFYLNDAPITAGVVLQETYDISQVEVLRGPQGTLRGRASPSGSVTVTTHKPDLFEAGGYVSATGNDIGGLNFNGAVGAPIIEGMLAVRVAGLYSEGEGNRVRPIDAGVDGRDPLTRSRSGRISAVFEPTDWLHFEGVYQRLDRDARLYDHYASFPGESQPGRIKANDRKSIQDAPRLVSQVYDIYNWNAEAKLAGQRLIYQGQHYTQDIDSRTNQDVGNFFPDDDFYQFTSSNIKSTSHEVRLQNEDRIFGAFDYVLGFFDNKNDTPTDLISPTAFTLPAAYIPGAVPASFGSVLNTAVSRVGESHEQSYFGNLTFHLDDATEISGGLRYIDYESSGALIINGGTPIRDPEVDETKLIYSASIKHNFSPDLMVYASTGTSWRPPISVVGVFGTTPSFVQQFLNIGAEESTSYELGMKSTLFDQRVRLNITGYYQEFENYPYRAPSAVNYVLDDGSGNAVDQFNFVAGVPVEVYGIEGELGVDITDNWDVNLVASYSHGKIKDGLIPCNNQATPSVADLLPDGIGSCNVTQRSSGLPPFSATLQSEYSMPVSDNVDGYLRGLFTFNGKSQTDPTVSYDDRKAYGILNLYTGVRDPDGTWEVTLFAKNLFDTQKVLSQESQSLTSYRNPAASEYYAPYNVIHMTDPQEFGLNVRFAFGSR